MVWGCSCLYLICGAPILRLSTLCLLLVTLPCSSSLDLCWTCLGIPSHHVFSACLGIGHWISTGPAQVFFLLMCCHFALVFII
jgi:hypothetical protein